MSVENDTCNYKTPIISAAAGTAVGAAAGAAVGISKAKVLLNNPIDTFVHQSLLNEGGENIGLVANYQTAVKEGKLKEFNASETGKKFQEAVASFKEKMKDNETLKKITKKAAEAAKSTKVKWIAGLAAAGLAIGTAVGFIVKNSNNLPEEKTTQG